MTCDIFAVRGAIAPVADDKDAVHEATARLLDAMLTRNRLRTGSVIFAFFTVTSDLDAAFPATAARTMGWDSVPMMCALEIPVEGALAKCIRVLLLCRKPPEPRPLRKRNRWRDAMRPTGVVAPLSARSRRGRRVAKHRPVHVYLGDAAALRPDLAEA